MLYCWGRNDKKTTYSVQKKKLLKVLFGPQLFESMNVEPKDTLAQLDCDYMSASHSPDFLGNSGHYFRCSA
jgi:hypothetical protein